MTSENTTVLESANSQSIDERVRALMNEMTLAEKIGQTNQINAAHGEIPDWLRGSLAHGNIGSLLNEVDVDTVNELQRIAVQESRLGIPLLIGRDVIHGFKTVFPIPIGQAATWNPELVEASARIAAEEAAATGVNWTFAPMIDVTRDPRWGRIAESLGEDPFLASALGIAMVAGFQGDDLSALGSIAACAKHFAGYGASESGRDYNTTSIPEIELRNVYLPPFNAVANAGVASFMTSFSDLNGVPSTGNKFLLKTILRDEWGFTGFVVSDWDSIRQLSDHGYTEDDRHAGLAAASAGVDMDMASTIFAEHLAPLVEDGELSIAMIDTMVANILRVKFQLGLFENAFTEANAYAKPLNAEHLAAAKRSALQSVVLLKNDSRVLPLSQFATKTLAVIGPMADEPYEQLGTWVFDGVPEYSRTPLESIRSLLGERGHVNYVRAMETTRSKSDEGFAQAVEAAQESDAVIFFGGEESILSGEAHSRANIDLPGKQAELIKALRDSGKPIILVVMAGRPLTLTNIIDDVDAILFAWHPGTMGGLAIADLLFGVESPSGKLPVTFPRVVGQVPIYYAHKNTGRPASQDTFVHMDDIDANAAQTSLGMTSFHLDAGFTPLFEFGYGLSYAEFVYRSLNLSRDEFAIGESVTATVTVQNVGDVDADEVVQLYIRDLVANVTRPVRQLKGFRRLHLQAGESQEVEFQIASTDLAFYGVDMQSVIEPGEFHVWIGGASSAELWARFRLVP